jgi:purine nucleosidase
VPGTPRRRLILDTDLAMGEPGSEIDDGFALALALAEPELTVEVVTTVNGNTDVNTATRLSRELLDRLGHLHIDVVRGASKPLLSEPDTSVVGPPSNRRIAATEIVERVTAEPGALTVVAIGPLTNVAIALLLEPWIAAAVREIVVMGGVFQQHTNIATMPGEFNFWTDPEAAEIVLRSGAPMRIVGLDVTRRVRLTRESATAMTGAFGRFAAESTLRWIDRREREHPGDPLEQGSCALHDPLAVAVVADPALVTWRSANLRVETAGRATRGVCIADLQTMANPPTPNCQIAVDVDVDGFVQRFLDRISTL